VGSSPETFLTVDRHGFVESSPIKGTRPRDSDPVADRRAARELRESEKEQAENLMIVDLVRNDLSRVAVPGSVEVTELLAVHSYRHVHQLVSTVRARLAPGASGLDAVRAAFPPGSMTGAPKRSAVELLAGLEAGPRGPYAGVAGRLGRDGTVDLAVVIRTVVLDLSTGLARVGVGGGITASSDPEAEVAEFHLKARALLAVLQSG
jgi:anthranilate/para-aminobenzoate synthase component I